MSVQRLVPTAGLKRHTVGTSLQCSLVDCLKQSVSACTRVRGICKHATSLACRGLISSVAVSQTCDSPRETM